MNFSHMRIARPVSDLEKSSEIYCAGLGLQQIAEFSDHDGFSGVMLRLPSQGWHLEFTVCQHHPIIPRPTEDDLLVLYVPDHVEWVTTCARMVAAGFTRLDAFNPYWDVKGATFVDPDGYRVVLQNSDWVL
ncbi:VOC family protein [Cedecea neteri]|uniref:Prolyl endopeptidase n=1 Tax=Cedecea neteri TaxID=158822 RepID=A0A291DXZ6_9ENTR|nr:VOC family protein [Cedecea neteri]ATF92552.1 prolyl endopeptidase [Cedecea neteri]